MFSLDHNLRYHLCQRYVNMNKGINGLYTLIKNEFPVSPISGDVFIFFAKNRCMVKMLRWDGDGFILYQKRLEEGTFEVPVFNPTTGKQELCWDVLLLIMRGISTSGLRKRKRFSLDKQKQYHAM